MTPVRFLRIVRQRLRSVFWRNRLETELDREMAFHVEQLAVEKLSEGMPPEDARLAARREIGNVAVLKDQCRDMRGIGLLEDVRQDVVYGVRTLTRSRTFTAVAVASLALGIGATTAVLGVMDAVRRDAVPLPNANRLVVIRTMPLANPSQTSGVSLAEFLAWRDRSRAFERMELSLTGPRDLRADEDGQPAERITGQSVTPGLFAILGVQPLLGRLFRKDDLHAEERVIISYRLWQRRYGADPRILGRRIRIDRVSRTVIGVMAEDFRFGDPRVDCWTPFAINPSLPAGPGRFFGVTALLKPDATLSQAQADLDGMAQQLAKQFPQRHAGWGVRVISLRDALYGWTREPLLTLGAAALLVLLIACANVAALLLSRTTVRRREIGMRMALGAGRGRVVRQLLTESVLLSVAGGLLGTVVAWCSVRGLTAMSPPFASPRMVSVGMNLQILGATALLSLITGLAFGLAPALTVSRPGPGRPFDSAVGAPAGGQPALRSVLVAAQLALALILLIGSGLLMNSFLRLTGRELNFEPAGLLTFEVRNPISQRRIGQYAGFDYFEMTVPPWTTMERIHERLRLVRGAASVAGSSFQPVDSLILPIVDLSIDGRSAPAGRTEHPAQAACFLVTPRFFQTIGTPILRGRELLPTDVVSSPWVAVVNETAARRFWPDGDPIGRSLSLDFGPEERPRTIVGVVRDIPVRRGQNEPVPVVYASYLQQLSRHRAPYGSLFAQMTFFMRHPVDPMVLLRDARRAVASAEPDLPMGDITTLDRRFDIGTRQRRYRVLLVGVLACTATMLAAVGVYGMLAYSVGRRMREIGIRKALGAGPRDVVAFVVRHTLAVVAGGLIVGWAGALALTRLMASQLWGITPTDPATYATVSFLLVSAAVLACLGPTRRALDVDPTIALRHE